jgi:hypothetical protein
MRKHEALCAEMEEVIGKAYKKHFGQSIRIQFYTVVACKLRRKAAE